VSILLCIRDVILYKRGSIVGSEADIIYTVYIYMYILYYIYPSRHIHACSSDELLLIYYTWVSEVQKSPTSTQHQQFHIMMYHNDVTPSYKLDVCVYFIHNYNITHIFFFWLSFIPKHWLCLSLQQISYRNYINNNQQKHIIIHIIHLLNFFEYFLSFFFFTKFCLINCKQCLSIYIFLYNVNIYTQIMIKT
jgi:hypothetical protein